MYTLLLKAIPVYSCPDISIVNSAKQLLEKSYPTLRFTIEEKSYKQENTMYHSLLNDHGFLYTIFQKL